MRIICRIFCDASPTGYGIIVMSKNFTMQISLPSAFWFYDNWDNNKSELSAILTGIRAFNDVFPVDSKKFIVFTDSAAAKAAIDNGLLKGESGWWDEIIQKFKKEHYRMFEANDPMKNLIFVKHFRSEGNSSFHLRLMKWCDYHSRSDTSFMNYIKTLSI